MDFQDISRRGGQFMLGFGLPALIVFRLLLLLPVVALALVCVCGVALVATRPHFPRQAEPTPGITPGPGWVDRFSMWQNANARLSVLTFSAFGSLVAGGLVLVRGYSPELAVKITLALYLIITIAIYGLARWLHRYGYEWGREQNP